jgi:nucleoside-diphosphate-sugar epimerase
VPVDGPGAPEGLAPTPVGEYANSCVARERMFEYFSHTHGTRGSLLRLSYAIDMRYGVLHDLAQALVQQRPISLAMGHANIIWQGDANEIALRSMLRAAHPMVPINLSGPVVSIRQAALGLARRLGATAQFQGTEAPTAWLVDCERMRQWFGPPGVDLERLLDWTAAWVSDGQASLGKPTHFEVRDGQY